MTSNDNDMKTRIAQATAKYEATKADLERAQSTLQASNVHLQAVKNISATLESRIQQLEQEKATVLEAARKDSFLQYQLEFEANFRATQARIDEVNAKIAETNRGNLELVKQLASLRETRQSLEKERDAMTEAYAKKVEELKEVSKTKDKLEIQRNWLYMEFKRLDNLMDGKYD